VRARAASFGGFGWYSFDRLVCDSHTGVSCSTDPGSDFRLCLASNHLSGAGRTSLVLVGAFELLVWIVVPSVSAWASGIPSVELGLGLVCGGEFGKVQGGAIVIRRVLGAHSCVRGAILESGWSYRIQIGGSMPGLALRVSGARCRRRMVTPIVGWK